MLISEMGERGESFQKTKTVSGNLNLIWLKARGTVWLKQGEQQHRIQSQTSQLGPEFVEP